ncbi:MAG: hypothetical protein HXX81_00285 [Campylobacterales bacterium]|nr:hypothetical protein [Campylobacterales bacterium]
MVREIIRPSHDYIQIQIPKEYINKSVEVLVFEIEEKKSKKRKKSTDKLVEEFRKLSKNIPKFESDLDLTKLDEDMNSDIF